MKRAALLVLLLVAVLGIAATGNAEAPSERSRAPCSMPR